MNINTRIWKEIETIIEKDDKRFSIGPISEGNYLEWIAHIKGPEDSPYRNGVFTINIELNNDYPFNVPLIKFNTFIFHPNIDFDGTICISELENWLPTYTIYFIIEKIYNLIKTPNFDDSYNPQIKHLYEKDKDSFEEIANKYTDLYAKIK